MPRFHSQSLRRIATLVSWLLAAVGSAFQRWAERGPQLADPRTRADELGAMLEEGRIDGQIPDRGALVILLCISGEAANDAGSEAVIDLSGRRAAVSGQRGDRGASAQVFSLNAFRQAHHH